LAALGGCSLNLDSPKAEESTELVWSGRPVEIDGSAVGNTGVVLEIHEDAGAPGGFFYRIGNGCTAGGRVADDGRVSPVENFQPCRAEDVALIGRILIIAPPGLPGPDQPARLIWDEGSATLISVRGEIRFESDGRSREASAADPSRQ